jgi:hypothetical protein
MSDAVATLPSRTNAPAVGEQTSPGWQPGFLKLWPAIRRDVRIAFRHLHGESLH